MRYRAFFSYARADDRIASWLHRQLDGYRTPKALVGSQGELGPVPAKLHPIFRDRTDLEAGGHVDAALQQALLDSECLIVLCTPASAKSHWVNRECEAFLKLGREGRIFPVIGAGEPNSGDPNTECFPPALRDRGLLAADLREIKLATGHLVGDGREGGKLKLIAGLLGVKLDALMQRERRRQRSLLASLVAASALFAMLAAAAGGFAWLANINERRAIAGEQEARDNLARVFAERAWDLQRQGAYPKAVRYALAGWAASSSDDPAFGLALGRLLFDMSPAQYLEGHQAGVRTAKFSRDERYVVTASDDRSAIVWDAASGRAISVLKGHDRGLIEASFSPAGDRVLTRAPDATVRVWDAATGKELIKLGRPLNRVFGAGFSPDGALIATVSHDGKIRLLDANSAAEVAAPGAFRNGDFKVEFARDGRVLLSSGAYEANVWSVPSLRRTASFPHPDGLAAAVLGPDGARVLTVGREGGVRVWDATTGRMIASWRADGAVTSAAFSPDGEHVICGFENGMARIWETRTGRELAALNGHAGAVVSIDASKDGKRLATGSSDRTARVWDAATGAEVAVFRAHEGPVLHVAFSADGRTLLTAGEDGVAALWPIRSSRDELFSVRGGANDIVAGIVDTTARRAFSATEAGDVHLWDVTSGATLTSLRPTLPTTAKLGDVTVSFSPRYALSRQGGYFAGIAGPNAVIWNAVGAQIGAVTLPEGPLTAVEDLIVGDDGQTLVVFGQEGAAYVVNAITGRRVALQGHRSTVSAAAFSPDAKRIATASFDHTARIWDLASGKELVRLSGHEGLLQRVEFSRDGAYVVTAAGRVANIIDNTARIWDARTGRQLVVLSGHTDTVQAAIFNPQGTRVASVSNDKTLRIWDAATGRELGRVPMNDVRAADIAFTDTGEKIVVIGADNAARTFDVASLVRPTRKLVHDACNLGYLAQGSRRFSPLEIGSDPLIRAVWLRDKRRVTDDICQIAASD